MLYVIVSTFVELEKAAAPVAVEFVFVMDALETETVAAPLAADSTLAMSSDIDALDKLELIPDRETLRFTTTEAVWFNFVGTEAEAVADEVAPADNVGTGVPVTTGADVAISVEAALAVLAAEASDVAVTACVGDACPVAFEEVNPVDVLDGVTLAQEDADPLGCNEGVERSETVFVTFVDIVAKIEAESVVTAVLDGVRMIEAELLADGIVVPERDGIDSAVLVSL